jgi:hypothetical protein
LRVIQSEIVDCRVMVIEKYIFSSVTNFCACLDTRD